MHITPTQPKVLGHITEFRSQHASALVQYVHPTLRASTRAHAERGCARRDTFSLRLESASVRLPEIAREYGFNVQSEEEGGYEVGIATVPLARAPTRTRA